MADVRHPNHVRKYVGTLDELACDLENMDYESLAKFLDHLSSAVYKRSESDRIAGKGKLHAALVRSTYCLDEARDNIVEAWKICEPYMKKDND